MKLRSKKSLMLGGTFFIALSMMMSAGAMLVNMYFNAHQDTDMTTPGTSEPIALELSINDGGFQVVGQMHDLEIPTYYTNCDNGMTRVSEYAIRNDNSHPYDFIFNVIEDWFDNPESPYYGWTFGVKEHYSGEDINGDMIHILPGGGVYRFDIWYHADPYYATPPDGKSPVNIQFESWVSE